MKKIGQFLTSFVPFLCALLIQVTVSFVTTFIYGAIQGVKLAAQGITDTNEITSIIANSITPEVLLLVSALSGVVSILVFGLWYKKLIKGDPRKSSKDLFSLKGIVGIAVLGVALQIGISGILSLISSINPSWFDSYSDVMNILGEGNTLISFLFIGLIAPVSEEFVFRGVILKKFNRIMPFVAANVMQALLFGIFHFNLIQGIYGFVIGLFLGLIYKKTKSILGAIILHMVVNLSGILLGGIFSDGIFTLPVTFIIMILLAVLLIVVSMKLVCNTYGADDSILVGSELEDNITQDI
jgi:membrane protease YdiL (CAAX protease family)